MRDDSKIFRILSKIFRLLCWVLSKILCILFDLLFERFSRNYRRYQLGLSDRGKSVIMIIILAFAIKFSCMKGVQINFIGYGYLENMTKKECAALYEISKKEILRSIKSIESPGKVEFPELNCNGDNKKMKMVKELSKDPLVYEQKRKEKNYEVFIYADIEDSSYGILDRKYFYISICVEDSGSYKIKSFDTGEKYKDIILN